jgi:hypothetical protein
MQKQKRNRGMKNLLKLLSLTGFALLMTGCSSYDYYQVESNFKMSAASDRIPATITKGQGFEANFPRIATIAVKAPDFCVSESQSQRTGTARAETNVMQTTCVSKWRKLRARWPKQVLV